MDRLKALWFLLPLCGLAGCGRLGEVQSAAAESQSAAVAAAEDGCPAEPPSCRADSLPPADLPPSGEARRVLTTATAAYRMKLAVIANNLANTETPGFKRSRVVLEDLSYRHETMPGAEDTAGQFTPTGISVGRGVRVSAVLTDFRQGAFEHTGRRLDVAIDGAGFFSVTDPTGDICYTRTGAFSCNANGNLVLGSAGTGRLLEPPITIPEDATAITISPEGIVSVRQQGNSQMSQVGQMQLARFINPAGLLKLGENLYAETDASGAPTTGTPGQDSLGRLRQGMLEMSNVQRDEELDAWADTTRTLRVLERLLRSDAAVE